MEVCQRSLNEFSIVQDVPPPKNCCYCIPHRLGLYILAILKLVLSLVMLIVILITLFLMMILSGMALIYVIMVLGFIAIFISLIDLFIGIVAVVSICVKDPGFLEMYYKYCVYVFRSLAALCFVMSCLTGFIIFSTTDMLARHIIVMSVLFSILLSILASVLSGLSLVAGLIATCLVEKRTENNILPIEKSFVED